MAYRPKKREAFGPPAAAWILPLVYLVAALVLTGIVLVMTLQTSGGWLYRYVVEGDDHRVLGARGLALISLLGALAVMLRTSMRGVTIHPDGVGYRDVVGPGWPQVRNCAWAEIDEIMVDRHAVALRLWNGDTLWLPKVYDHPGLRGALERVAVARSIPIRGEGIRTVEEVRAELENV